MNLNFSHSQVLIVGDVMLDSYWQGATSRISPEAPVPVVHVNDQTQRIGGAGNVAMNVISLGAQARLFTIMGDDESGKNLKQLLEQSGVTDYSLLDDTIPTTTKLRVLSQHQQLIRLDFEQPYHNVDASRLLDSFRSALKDANNVILSDYGKGVLHDSQPYIIEANQFSTPVLVDPKKENFDNYKGAYLITPNQIEFEAVVGTWSSPAQMVERARNVIEECELQGLLITQGGQGMTLVMNKNETRHFPAQAKDVYDVTGAGDTVIATLATAMSGGMSVEDAVHLSGKAAGIVVGRVGTASVSVEDLQELERYSSNKLSPVEDKFVNIKQLLKFVENYKTQGKKIVFTNGCFDLLHSGHVNYLQQAAALGDVLVVAVNSDASVTQLKGDGRPLNSIADRMTLLAGLVSVDYVIEFNEETPEQLICLVKPDFLVKGGDYSVDEIVGRECASEVVVIDMTKGKSTTSMVKKIQSLNLE